MSKQGETINDLPYRTAVAITLSDSTVYGDPVGVLGSLPANIIPDAWYVGVSGDVTIVDMAGNTTLLKNCVQGTIYKIAATKFKNTGTNATNLVALYY